MHGRLATVMCAWVLAAAADAAGRAPSVALLGFESKGEYAYVEYLGQSLTRLTQAELSRIDDVRVMERTQVDLILDEMRLQKSPLFNPAHVEALGHALPADYHVYGTLEALFAKDQPLASARVELTVRVRRLRDGQVVRAMHWQATVGRLQEVARSIADEVAQALGSSAPLKPLARRQARRIEIDQILKKAAATNRLADRNKRRQLLTAAYFLAPHDPAVLYQLALDRRAGLPGKPSKPGPGQPKEPPHPLDRARPSGPRWSYWVRGICHEDPKGRPTHVVYREAYVDPEVVGWLMEIVRDHSDSEWVDDALFELARFKDGPIEPKDAWRLALEKSPNGDRVGDLGAYVMAYYRDITSLDDEILAHLSKTDPDVLSPKETLGACGIGPGVSLFKPVQCRALDRVRTFYWLKKLRALHWAGRFDEAIAMILAYVDAHPNDPWNCQKLWLAGEYYRAGKDDLIKAREMYERAIAVNNRFRRNTELLKQGFDRDEYWRYDVMDYRRMRHRYSYGVVLSYRDDRPAQLNAVDRAMALWEQDRKDFNVDPSWSSNDPVLMVAARSAVVLGRDDKARGYYEELAKYAQDEDTFARGSELYEEYLSCMKRLGLEAEAQRVLARFNSMRVPPPKDSPYSFWPRWRFDAQLVMVWRGQLLGFLRFEGRDTFSTHAPLYVCTLLPDTKSLARKHPVFHGEVTTPVTGAVLVGDDVWLATRGQGVFVGNLATEEWRHLGPAEGLLDETVEAIGYDARRNEIWCSFRKAAGALNLTTGKWRTVGNSGLVWVEHIYADAECVYFWSPHGVVRFNQRTGRVKYFKEAEAPAMPMLAQDGWVYWIEHGRTLFRTNAQGERVGPSFSAKDIYCALRPVVANDIFVFMRRGQVVGADFRHNRMIPFTSRDVIWVNRPSCVAFGGKLFLSSSGRFTHQDMPGGPGGGHGMRTSLLSFDLQWLEDHDPKALPNILSRVVKQFCCPRL